MDSSDPVSWLTAVGIGNLSAGALVVLVVLMLFTGRLVTRREHDGRIADKDVQIDQWRAAYETSERARATLLATSTELTEQGRINVELLRDIARHTHHSQQDTCA